MKRPGWVACFWLAPSLCASIHAATDPLAVQEAIVTKGFTVAAGKSGSMAVTLGKSEYSITSSFSFPGRKIGRNSLPLDEQTSEKSWRPTVTKRGDGQIEIAASGEHYSLKRNIIVGSRRIRVEDTLTNLGASPVGIMGEHVVSGHAPFTDVRLAGAAVPSVSRIAENPSIFLTQQGSSLGVLAEDNLFRLQFEAASSMNRAIKFGVRHFALRPGATYTFRWTLYPFERKVGYFDFINAVRRDWKANATIEGPFDWIEVTQNPMLDDPATLKAYLTRRKLRIVGLKPFHAYWLGAPYSQDEFKAIMQKAMKAFRAASPGIRCVGSTENNIVAYERARMKSGHLFDGVCTESGAYPLELSAEQTRILEEETPWKDSLVKTRHGRAMIEDCPPKTFVQPMVYAAPGNYHERYLMEQVKFLIEDVGMDGIYMDHFNMAWDIQQRYDYSKWDGHTVDVNADTGRLESKYTDAGFVGIESRKKMCEYIFSKGKVLVVNTQNVANETQSMPIQHFEEVGSNANPLALKRGEKPPLIGYIAKHHLGRPVGLGIPSTNVENPDIQDIREVMKTAIVYLRHGLLYYHNQTTVPETGPGSGEYGPMNHMYPLTPVRLFEGGVEGRERTITCVSGSYTWRGKRRPRVLLFDETGRDKKHNFRPERSEAGWKVAIELQDWQEIAVIE